VLSLQIPRGVFGRHVAANFEHCAGVAIDWATRIGVADSLAPEGKCEFVRRA